MNHETRETFGTQTVYGNIFSFTHSLPTFSKESINKGITNIRI